MEQTRRGAVMLVLGGARRGKSRYAQKLPKHAGRVVYISTAQAGDAQIRGKTLRHRDQGARGWLAGGDLLDIIVPAYPLGRRFRDLLRNRQMDSDDLAVSVAEECLLSPSCDEVRGHSLHYSRVSHAADELPLQYKVQCSGPRRTEDEGCSRSAVLANFAHLPYPANPEVELELVAARRSDRKKCAA
jgi:hypothetical protein